MRLTIEKLVYGGAGLARTEQGVLFVPRTAPGDVVDVEIVGKKKDYATGRVIEILEPSLDRQEPYCPNYATAGCCHWQHIRYDRQVEYKEAILRETLRRIGHFEWNEPIQHLTARDRNYRLRATFHVINGRLGFVRENTNTVVPIRSCTSLVPELNEFIGKVDPGPAREVHAMSVPEVIAAFVLDGGLIQRSRRGTVQAGDFQFRATADTFFQANRFLLGAMINEVLQQAGPTPGNVLDLYAGVGFFSIPIARVAKEVIAIESNRTAVRLAQESARMNQTYQLRAVEGQVAAILRDSGLRPNVVIVDPPRAGCGEETANRIAELKPNQIIYVSCNPATFAREAARFLVNGYELRRLTLVDQFPNTYHIESIASFELR
jgi:23S rRNA (uracil1939-C5)-methyltransferase